MNIPYTFTKIITKGEINCHEGGWADGDMVCYDMFGEEIQDSPIRFVLVAVSLGLMILYVVIFAIYYPKIVNKLKK